MIDTQKLRQRILDLAIRGKLVPQDPNDEPASVLLEKIRAEKERLIAEGKIKRPKAKKTSDKSHYEDFVPPFEIPNSWEWVTVGDISSSILYGVSQSAKTSGKYHLLRITDIQDNTVDWDSVPFTDFDNMKANQYILENGDIVFARTGATVGKSYLVEDAPDNSIYASYLIRIKTSKEVYPEYLKLFFESGFYWQQISEDSVGIGQPNVNGTSLGMLKLPIPPKREQIRIIKASSEIIELVNSLNLFTDSLKETINITKSKILALAMQGKLVEQNTTDESAADMLLRINPKAKIITDNPHYPQLPDNWAYISLEDINEYRSKSITPANNPEEIFELYSVPTYPTGAPELLKGNEIGSSKQLVMMGDVLVCKINPHINRVWHITK